jgi:hypothetical protein
MLTCQLPPHLFDKPQTWACAGVPYRGDMHDRSGNRDSTRPQRCTFDGHLKLGSWRGGPVRAKVGTPWQECVRPSCGSSRNAACFALAPIGFALGARSSGAPIHRQPHDGSDDAWLPTADQQGVALRLRFTSARPLPCQIAMMACAPGRLPCTATPSAPPPVLPTTPLFPMILPSHGTG